MKQKTAYILMAIFIPAIGVLAYMNVSVYQNSNNLEPVGCTAEAKMCPDGSSVGRIAPDCAFAPCPKVDDSRVGCTAEAKMCPDGSFVGRIAPDCNFASCPESKVDVIPGCAEDVKICQDGSVAERMLPDCNFAPCPDVYCLTDSKECSNGTHVFRVLPDCEFAPCPSGGPGKVIDDTHTSSITYGEDTSRMEEYRTDCASKGGVFNSCASYCDGNTDPDLMCTAVCVIRCENIPE